MRLKTWSRGRWIYFWVFEKLQSLFAVFYVQPVSWEPGCVLRIICMIKTPLLFDFLMSYSVLHYSFEDYYSWCNLFFCVSCNCPELSYSCSWKRLMWTCCTFTFFNHYYARQLELWTNKFLIIKLALCWAGHAFEIKESFICLTSHVIYISQYFPLVRLSLLPVMFKAEKRFVIPVIHMRLTWF